MHNAMTASRLVRSTSDSKSEATAPMPPKNIEGEKLLKTLFVKGRVNKPNTKHVMEK